MQRKKTNAPIRRIGLFESQIVLKFASNICTYLIVFQAIKLRRKTIEKLYAEREIQRDEK